MHTDVQKREGKAGNKKKPLASRPKNVSNELTDHIPTHKSQSQNHIQTRSRTASERGIALEHYRERSKARYDRPMSILTLHHMMQSHKWF